MTLLDRVRAARPDLDWETARPRALPALRSPAVPLKTLRRALRRAARPVLLVNDGARTLPRDLPWVLAELWEVGGRPPVVVATGTHRESEAAARDRLGGLPVEVHDADAARAHVALAPGARIDRRLARADLIVAFGSVEPHYFAGWGGAHKTATVGVLDRASIERNHRLALDDGARPLACEGNPVFDDLARIAAAIEEDRRLLAVNHVLDDDGRAVGLGVGTWRGSLRRCEAAARARFLHRVGPVDLLVAHATGPLGRTLYQADKGIKNTEAAVRPGGCLILSADLSDGAGPPRFLDLLARAPDLATARAAAQAEYRLGDHKAVRWRALEARGVRVLVASPRIDPALLEPAGIEAFASLEDALAEAPPGPGRALLVSDAGRSVVLPPEPAT